MKSTVLILFLVASCAVAAEKETDSKATETKMTSITSGKDDKANKQEKRAPVIMTSNPGESKYTSDPKYSPELKYLAAPEVGKLPSVYQTLPQPAPKPQYIFYTPQTQAASVPATTTAVPHQQTQMVLMFAVPHPSGQFLMLLPAQNFIYPMYYRAHNQLQQIPAGYQHIQHPAPSSYQPTYSAPALAQSAGFAAQQQLAYSGPYRPERYNKQ